MAEEVDLEFMSRQFAEVRSDQVTRYSMAEELYQVGIEGAARHCDYTSYSCILVNVLVLEIVFYILYFPIVLCIVSHFLMALFSTIL